MKMIGILFLASTSLQVLSQDATALLNELSESACKCIDSIDTGDKSAAEIYQLTDGCISESASSYQLGLKLYSSKMAKKDTTIKINFEANSADYKSAYYALERKLMESCNSLKNKIATNDKISNKSYSNDPVARKYYSEGLKAFKVGDLEMALNNYIQATNIDPDFAFAWDNQGFIYRKLNKYEDALRAYQQSLKVEPEGLMPLHNIPVVYQYMGKYDKAVDAYKTLAKKSPDDPEAFFGMGIIYAFNMNDLETGLENLCKAYTLYIAQKSPYRTDAETVLSKIYNQLKTQGKEELFYKILKKNNIQVKMN